MAYQQSQELINILIKKRVLYFHEIQILVQIKRFYELINMPEDFYITALFYGNIHQSEAENLFSELFLSKLNKKSIRIENQLTLFSENEIKDFLYFHYELKGSFIIRLVNLLWGSKDQVANNYFFVDHYSISNDIISTLLSLLWEKDFQNIVYKVVKNVQMVVCKKEIIDNLIYFNFIVQSLEDPKDVNNQMDKVIEELRTKIRRMTEDGLYDAKEIFIIKQNSKDTSIESKSKEIFKQIYTDNLQFEKENYDRDMLKEYTLDKIITLFDRVFYSNVAKLSIQFYKNEESQIIIKDEPYALNNTITSIVSGDYNFFDKKEHNR